jgi:sugar transferase (PEP-CTERM/EpsH1 system associated)
MPPLLFLTQRIPYPPIKGEKIRPYHVLQHLRRSFDIHLGTLVDDPADRQHIPAVQAMCAGSHFATLDRRRAKVTCLAGLLTGEPLSVTFFRDRGLARWVQGVMDRVRPVAIYVFSSNMAPYVLGRRGRERACVVDLTDVDSEKWRAYAEAGAPPMRWVHHREWRRVAALEARILRECDWSTFVSNEEAALFARLNPGHDGRIRAISNGVDCSYFDPALPWDAPYRTDHPTFVFTGTMDYPPNVDAVAWFAESVLPLVRKAAPGAAFGIVGSSPAPRVQALAALPGVFVTGRVPDVRPYLAHAAAAVAPMRIARGIQNKVLEAMAMARPVVVTPDALEGIAARPGTEVLLAADADAFAAACLHALMPAGTATGAAARERVLQDYGWTARLRGFDPLFAPALAPAA